uniref:glutathione S-transferase A-like n=1 Tax=Doryrhamphus excisus TaxID=161450 RepID=UPI0025ADC95B|nr:glutathione S-transferase A-like [Doryrhamphus excisus]
MAKDITVYWGSGSPPCWRVLIALEEKKLQGYNSEMLSFEKREQKSEKVMAINPRGQFPSLKYGNYVVNESCGACFFLENQFKDQGTRLVPDCPAEQAMMYQRLFEGLAFWQKLGAVVHYEWKVPAAERHDSAVQRNRQDLTVELQLWEGYLAKGPGPFLSGKTFSLADIVVFPILAFAIRFGLKADRYPKLAAYYNALKARPSIKATWPPTWKGSQAEDILKGI